MKFTEEIFKRATIAGVAEYLLFGPTIEEEKGDYVSRIDNARSKFKEVAMRHNSEKSSDLLDAADDMVGENMNIFMEIGLQAGLLLVLDMIKNLNAEKAKQFYNAISEVKEQGEADTP